MKLLKARPMFYYKTIEIMEIIDFPHVLPQAILPTRQLLNTICMPPSRRRKYRAGALFFCIKKPQEYKKNMCIIKQPHESKKHCFHHKSDGAQPISTTEQPRSSKSMLFQHFYYYFYFFFHLATKQKKNIW